jgi:hypothetical protein
MGHGPSIKNTVEKSEEAKDAVNAAVKKAAAALKNTEKMAHDYINKHTKGIIQDQFTNNKSYSKFSDEFSLKALDIVVDGFIKVAQDYLSPDKNPTKASKMAGDIGSVVKSTLALAAMSSSTDSNLQVIFNHIIAGDENYAMYYACNSMTVKAENAWGNKEITVVSNMYLFTKVKPDPEVTHAKILQENLDTLVTLNEQYDKAIIVAKSQKELDGLTFNQNKIQKLQQSIQKDLENI